MTFKAAGQSVSVCQPFHLHHSYFRPFHSLQTSNPTPPTFQNKESKEPIKWNFKFLSQISTLISSVLIPLECQVEQAFSQLQSFLTYAPLLLLPWLLGHSYSPISFLLLWWFFLCPGPIYSSFSICDFSFHLIIKFIFFLLCVIPF